MFYTAESRHPISRRSALESGGVRHSRHAIPGRQELGVSTQSKAVAAPPHSKALRAKTIAGGVIFGREASANWKRLAGDIAALASRRKAHSVPRSSRSESPSHHFARSALECGGASHRFQPRLSEHATSEIQERTFRGKQTMRVKHPIPKRWLRHRSPKGFARNGARIIDSRRTRR
jgi:hypothetical protein